tara:strand:+ start:3612 stop:3812 length:201 start_codon:yes stop_codon:yes gene_type:complete
VGNLDIGQNAVGVVLVEGDALDLAHLDTIELDLAADAEPAHWPVENDAIVVIRLTEPGATEPHHED